MHLKFPGIAVQRNPSSRAQGSRLQLGNGTQPARRRPGMGSTPPAPRRPRPHGRCPSSPPLWKGSPGREAPSLSAVRSESRGISRRAPRPSEPRRICRCSLWGSLREPRASASPVQQSLTRPLVRSVPPTPTQSAGDSLAHPFDLFDGPAALCFGGDAVYTACLRRRRGERNESGGRSDRSTHCPVSWIPAQRPLSLSMGLHGAVARARPTRAHAPAFSVRSPDATSRAPSSVPPRHLALGLSVPRRGRLHYMPGVNDGGKFSSVSLVLLSYLGQNAKAHACRLEEDVS